MPVTRELLTVFECCRCTHKWLPKHLPAPGVDPDPPKVCPRCKSPYWNLPRRRADLVGRREPIATRVDDGHDDTDDPHLGGYREF